MLCLSRKRMVVTKDQPHGPGRSVPMFIVVECEDHSAIQAPQRLCDYIRTNFKGFHSESYHITNQRCRVREYVLQLIKLSERMHRVLKVMDELSLFLNHSTYCVKKGIQISIVWLLSKTLLTSSHKQSAILCQRPRTRLQSGLSPKMGTRSREDLSCGKI